MAGQNFGNQRTTQDLMAGNSRIVDFVADDTRVVAQSKGRFSVITHARDRSVSPDMAMMKYYMAEMEVYRRQVLVELDGTAPVVLQSGAMQWILGDVSMKTGVKGAGDLFGKALRGKATGESAIKPEYSGSGVIALEPTWRYIILEDVSKWNDDGGLVIEDGMFLACDGTVTHGVQSRQNVSSALAGGEGLFNLKLSGNGIAALESNVPASELVRVELFNDTLKLDGPYAVMWSGSLAYTVERSSKSLIGSAASGEGLVNVFRGTGIVYMSPVTPSRSLFAATHS